MFTLALTDTRASVLPNFYAHLLDHLFLDSDENGNWANIADDLTARLPLRGLVWKPSNGRATRNIAMLDVELKRFSPESSKNLPPVTLLQNPYLNLYFVNCEVSVNGILNLEILLLVLKYLRRPRSLINICLLVTRV